MKNNWYQKSLNNRKQADKIIRELKNSPKDKYLIKKVRNKDGYLEFESQKQTS